MFVWDIFKSAGDWIAWASLFAFPVSFQSIYVLFQVVLGSLHLMWNSTLQTLPSYLRTLPGVLNIKYLSRSGLKAVPGSTYTPIIQEKKCFIFQLYLFFIWAYGKYAVFWRKRQCLSSVLWSVLCSLGLNPSFFNMYIP